MPSRRIRIDPSAALEQGFRAVEEEAGVPRSFPPEATAAAEEAARARRPTAAERMDIPFVTIDPPGSRDLDQALHIERSGDGHRVRYAIADVAAFVTPGDAIDLEAHARGVTVYSPDSKAPLHPPALSEGAASLLPGEWRPAVLWTFDLDGRGEMTACDVRRAEVRSTAQHTYEDVPADLEPLLRDVGERRIALERARGGTQLNVPEQEVVQEGGAWKVRYRPPVASEDWNAQISLLTGMAAAALMLEAGIGILRTQPAPDVRALDRLRRQARALAIDWPETTSYPDFVHELNPGVPSHAALMHEATGLGGGAGYTVFDGSAPAQSTHFAIAAPYAHATAPLRRLQDRYVCECCLAACAGTPLPDWVRAGLPGLPAAMSAGAQRARKVERGIIDLVEAVLLAGREGEQFDAVAIDGDMVQLAEPAVRAKLAAGGLEAGHALRVRLERADPASRTVEFTLAA